MQASLPKLPESIKSWIPTFPLYEYESPISPHVVPASDHPVMLISQPLTASPQPWASSSAPCLRYQLLFLLAGVPFVSYRTWADEDSVPGRTLPSLTLPSSPTSTAILSSNEIRPWLDHRYPVYSPSTPHHGYPSPSAEAEARAFGRLVESQIYPAILASNPTPSNLSTLLPLLPFPPPPLAGLSSLLPAFLFSTTVNVGVSGSGLGGSGGKSELESTSLRKFDLEGIKRGGVEAIKAIAVRLRAEKNEGGGWFLGCENPSPLDCLIASHLFVILYSPVLNNLNPLRLAVKKEKVLVAYIERVLRELDGRRLMGASVELEKAQGS